MINNLSYLVLFASIEGVDIRRIQEIIINSNNANAIYMFLVKIPNCDTYRLEEALKKIGDIEYIDKYETLKNKENSKKILKLCKN